MTAILEIYKHYKIMPQLQLHQLRVAAVANQICDSLNQTVNEKDIITACLLHDMGNIIKFDLGLTVSLSGGSISQSDLEYWQNVQQEYLDTYGPDEHQASIDIAKEIGVNKTVIEYIASIGFETAIKNSQVKELGPKICDYSDLRVSPQKVVTIDGRLEDGKRRYQNRPERWVSEQQWQELRDACYQTERQIFKVAKISPSDITDSSIKPYIEKLKQYSM